MLSNGRTISQNYAENDLNQSWELKQQYALRIQAEECKTLHEGMYIRRFYYCHYMLKSGERPNFRPMTGLSIDYKGNPIQHTHNRQQDKKAALYK